MKKDTIPQHKIIIPIPIEKGVIPADRLSYEYQLRMIQ